MRADMRAGVVASTVANVMGDGKKAYAPMDFMPFHRNEQVRTSAQTGPQDVLFDPDPEVQSRLIMAALFGVTAQEVKRERPARMDD